MSILQPLVYTIVLNWNGLQDTLRCVRSLERQTYPNQRILVFDNGSADGSAETLRTLGPRVTLIESERNLGYTGGNNRAMEAAFAAGAAYVWLFNNDAVASPDTLARLVALAETDARIGLVSPVVRESETPDSALMACGWVDPGIPAYRPTFDLAEARTWHAHAPDRIALHGTALLIKRALMERIGGLDERLFAYWEDIDYSIRSIQAGFRNVMAFDVFVTHPLRMAQAESGQLKPHCHYFGARNELLLWRKVVAGRRLSRAALWSMLRHLRLIRRMSSNPDGIEAILAGLWDGWRGVGGPYDPSRRMPQPLRWMLGRHPRVWLTLIHLATGARRGRP